HRNRTIFEIFNHSRNVQQTFWIGKRRVRSNHPVGSRFGLSLGGSFREHFVGVLIRRPLSETLLERGLFFVGRIRRDVLRQLRIAEHFVGCGNRILCSRDGLADRTIHCEFVIAIKLIHHREFLAHVCRQPTSLFESFVGSLGNIFCGLRFGIVRSVKREVHGLLFQATEHCDGRAFRGCCCSLLCTRRNHLRRHFHHGGLLFWPQVAPRFRRVAETRRLEIAR